MGGNANRRKLVNDAGAAQNKFSKPKKCAITSTLSVTVLILISVLVPLATTSKTTNGTALSVSEDYQLWVQPYLAQLEKVRAVLMTPYTIGNQHYGYDSTTGLVRGGNIEPSPAIGVKNGYNDVIVAIDNNLEGSASLDFFNSAASPFNGQVGFIPINTNIYGNVRALLAETWIGIGACNDPFTQYSYPSSFSLLDRREAEYGSTDPYYSTLIKPGNHLGGIGNNCGTEGQTWFLPGYDSLPTSMTKPLIATEFPSNTPIGSTGDLEELSFYIDEMYLQCRAGTSPCSLWQNAYLNAMSQYPFAAPREALHFIQTSRATAAWTMSNMTYDGVSAYQMLQDTINRIWSSAVGPGGGLYQSFSGGGSDETPEPNFQAMIAFDPRMPSWFGQDTGYSSSSTSSGTTTLSSTSTATSLTTSTSGKTSSSTTLTTTNSSSSKSKTATSLSTSLSTSASTSDTTSLTSSSTSISPSSTSSDLPSGSTTTVTRTVYLTITNSSTVTEIVSANVSRQVIGNSETSFVTITQTTFLIDTSPIVSQQHSTNEEILTNASTSPKSATAISASNSTVQRSSLSLSSSSIVASLSDTQKQSSAKATLFGGLAAFETFVIGLIPVFSFANKNKFALNEASKAWRW
jgi:hypothetical protein